MKTRARVKSHIKCVASFYSFIIIIPFQLKSIGYIKRKRGIEFIAAAAFLTTFFFHIFALYLEMLSALAVCE